LAVAGKDAPVKLRDLATKQERDFPHGHAAGVFALAFLADSRTLVTVGADGAKLWDVASDRQQPAISDPTDKYGGAAFSQDRKTLALSCMAGERKRLYDLTNPNQPRHRMDVLTAGSGHALALSPDNEVLAGTQQTVTEIPLV